MLPSRRSHGSRWRWTRFPLTSSEEEFTVILRGGTGSHGITSRVIKSWKQITRWERTDLWRTSREHFNNMWYCDEVYQGKLFTVQTLLKMTFCPFQLNSDLNNSTTIGWIAIKFGKYIHGSAQMNPTKFEPVCSLFRYNGYRDITCMDWDNGDDTVTSFAIFW